MSVKYYKNRNESDIFFVNSNIKHYEVNRPAKDYHTKYYNKDHLQKFVNKPKNDKNLNTIGAFPSNKDISERIKSNNVFKSQISFGDYSGTPRKAQNNKINPPKFKGEITAYQRKIKEMTGTDINDKELSRYSDKICTRGILNKEIRDNDLRYNRDKQKKYSEKVCNSQPSSNRRRVPRTKSVEVKPTSARNNSLANKLSMLQSNIFNDPQKEYANNHMLIKYKEKDIDAFPVKRFKRSVTSNLQSSFDWKDSKNEIWLSKLHKDKPELSAKERKFDQLRSSLDNNSISFQDTIESNHNHSLVMMNYDKKKKIAKTKDFYRNKSTATVRRHVDNISALMQNDFVNESFNLYNKEPELIHSFQIDNVNTKDIPLIKRCFISNGLHLYDTRMKGYNICNADMGKVILKVRENSKDKSFKNHFMKVRKELKKNNISIKDVQQPKKAKVESIPSGVEWDNERANLLAKGRYEKSLENERKKKSNRYRHLLLTQ